MDQYWGRVQGYLNALFSWRGMEGVVAEETAVLPGMEELASLMQITALADSGRFDVIIIDAAPTGSTLQLLSFPDMARWYLEKVFPFQRRAVQLARPVMKRMSDMPLPDEDVFDSIEELVNYLERMSQLLGDGEISSVRLVLNPEKMVVKEAQRAYTYLNLYGYSVDSVVCNRVFPQELRDAYFDGWKQAQAANLELVREAFQPLPIFEIPFFQSEVTGMEMLQQLADSLYGPVGVQGAEGDPTQKYFIGQPQEIARQNGHYVLSIALPLVERDEVHLHRSVFDELVVRIGNWKRNVSLPIGLSRLEVSSAKFEGDRLNIFFPLDEDAPLPTPDELKPNRWQVLKKRLGGENHN
jgi:arsenite-transporting ATPase